MVFVIFIIQHVYTDAYDILCSCSRETVHPHARTILPCIGNMQRVCFSISAIDPLEKHELQREECSDTFQRDVKMTKEEFYAKRLELLMQSIDAQDAIVHCAKQHGTWKMGLDSNRALFKTLEETYRGKIAELERQARIEGILPESEKSN